ncbi:cyclin-dependent kinase inhibitor 1B [Emydura macquarii macquarii]|uniref:cyclin-dependent kinase inhibitor 1B n=1 Tax=Emydura macquarii macquarii TaxID=1129001 RepID=UPI003529FF5F
MQLLARVSARGAQLAFKKKKKKKKKKAAAAGRGCAAQDSAVIRSEPGQRRREQPQPEQDPEQGGAAGAGGTMSNVRVSNGSPPLERMEARQAEYPKPSACRSLFGPVNHDELSRELRRHRRDMEAACQRKWNFDFQQHRPLAGRFEWQALEKGSSPDFYFRAPRRPKALRRPAGPEGLDVNGNCPARTGAGSQGISADTRFAEPKAELSAPHTDWAEQAAGPRKRPATEDSSPQPKRANTTEEVSEESPSVSSVEQTPKKSSPKRCQT